MQLPFAFEATAAALGLVSTFLYVRQNAWTWPIGLVMVSMYVVVYYQAKFYGNMVLHGIFILIQFYGWHQWRYGGDDHHGVHTQWLPQMYLTNLLISATILVPLMAMMLTMFSDAQLTFWDSAVFILSLQAQWLSAKKYIESMFFWLVVDIITASMCLYQGLYPTAALYTVFAIMVIYGYKHWRGQLASA